MVGEKGIAMGHHTKITLESEADITVIAALSKLLGPEVRHASDFGDLQNRLGKKGFQVRQGYLATAPEGKLIWPIEML